MHLTCGNSETTTHVSKGAFHLNIKDLLAYNKKVLHSRLPELVGKKVLFMTGGVGRLANYATSLGIDSYSLDINPVYAVVCKKNYPNVTPIVGDMFKPLKGFDYIFLEDAFNTVPVDFLFFQMVNHWQMVGKILPWDLKIQPISFDCSLLFDYFSYIEPDFITGINDYFNSGSMELWTRLDELDRYNTYETCIDLRTQIRHLKFQKDESFDFFGFICNITRATDKSYVRIKLKNDGVDKKFFKFDSSLIS